jgi:hypothetical protein
MRTKISKEASEYLYTLGCVYPNIPEAVMNILRANAGSKELDELGENNLDKHILAALVEYDEAKLYD